MDLLTGEDDVGSAMGSMQLETENKEKQESRRVRYDREEDSCEYEQPLFWMCNTTFQQTSDEQDSEQTVMRFVLYFRAGCTA